MPAPVVASLALALGCVLLAYGLWHYRPILVAQPIWPPGALRHLLVSAAIFALLVLALRALPALPSRVTASALIVVYLVVATGPQAVLGALLLGLACVAAGDLLLGRWPSSPSLPGRLVLALMSGAALFALLVTFTAHLPVNSFVFFAAVCAAVVAIDARGLLRIARAAADWYKRPSRWDVRTFASAALLGGIVLLQSVRALLPETGGDGLGMHLVVSSQLAVHREWSFDPALFEWGLFPLASEWLQGIGWTFAGEPAARLVQFGFTLAAVATIVVVARRFASPAAALLAGALFASAGLAFGLAANTYAEPALTAFALGAFAVATLPKEGWSPWVSVVFGVLSGGALLTKVTALYVLIPLVALFAARLVRDGGWRWALRHSAIATGTLLAVGAWPFIYAFARTGNPVFPLYNEVFRSSLAPLERPPDPRWFDHFSWKLPYVATFRSSYYCETYNGTLGFQYLTLLPLAVVVAVSRKSWTALSALAVGIVGAVALLASMQYLRYVFPMMALVSITLAAAFTGGRTSPAWRWVTLAAVVAAAGVIALNLALAPGGQWNLPGFDGAALFSGSTRRVYEDKYAPQRTLTALVNEESGPDVRVAYFGPAYGAGLEGTPLFAMGYNPGFRDETAAATTGAEMLAVLQANDAHYVITPLEMAGAGTPLGDALTVGAEQVAVVNGAALFRLHE